MISNVFGFPPASPVTTNFIARLPTVALFSPDSCNVPYKNPTIGSAIAINLYADEEDAYSGTEIAAIKSSPATIPITAATTK